VKTLFLFLTDEVLSLEHDDLHDLQHATELDEVEHVVPSKPEIKKKNVNIGTALTTLCE
jgi:hypothetical protein